jgi:chromosome segregation ATPase
MTMEDMECVIQRLKKRNSIQTEPFRKIFQSNSKLFFEYGRLQKQQNDMKRQVAVLQNETAELLNKMTSTSPSESANFVEKMKSKLATIQNELREKQSTELQERKLRLDLSKTVRDQKKLLADVNEELVVAKTELASARMEIMNLSTQFENEKRSSDVLKAELDHLRELCATAEKRQHELEIENKQLIDRILVEKKKTADEINEMNHLVDGALKLCI